MKFGNIGMSKIGKKIIIIPDGVVVEVKDGKIYIKRGKEETNVPILYGVEPILNGKELRFEIKSNTKQGRSNWGTLRSIVMNVITGLVKGFEKTLVIEGVGFRIAKDGDGLVLNLGFSHPVKYAAVQGIEFEIEKNTILKVKGKDKALVGQVAAEIRSFKKPEPYKGKGFRYIDEKIRRKAGKKSGSASS